MAEEKEKKGYSVVDRRSAAGEPGEEPSPVSGETPAEKPEDRRSEEQPPPEEKGRIMKVQEFIILFLNLLRDQAALNLGMPLQPGADSQKNSERADFIVGLSKKVMERFGDKIFADQPHMPEESLDLSKLVLSYLAMLQEYILFYSGILANPMTGIATRELDQARLGIDLFSLIVDECASIIPALDLRRLTNVLSDLQLNFARQSGV